MPSSAAICSSSLLARGFFYPEDGGYTFLLNVGSHKIYSLQSPAHASSLLADFFTLKMKAIRSSETSVHTRSTRRHIPEKGILHSHRRENLKYYIGIQEIRETFIFTTFQNENSNECLYYGRMKFLILVSNPAITRL
jgi:hypothetical protein